MAHSRSAEKRVKQNVRRRLSNRSDKTYIKTRVKKFLAAVSEGSAASAADELRKTSQALDRAARKNIIHPNLAARKKARLAKKLSALGPVATETPPLRQA